MPRKILNDDFVLRNCPEYQPMGMPNAFLPKPNKSMMAGQELVEQRQVPQNATLMDLVNNVNLVPVSINERTEQLEQARGRVRRITPSAPPFDPEMLSGMPPSFDIGVPPPTFQEALAIGIPPPVYSEVLEQKEERGELLEEKSEFTQMSLRGLQQEPRSLRFNPLFLKEFDERIDYNQQKIIPDRIEQQEAIAYLQEQVELQRDVLLRKDLLNKQKQISKKTETIVNNMVNYIVPSRGGTPAYQDKQKVKMASMFLDEVMDLSKEGILDEGIMLRVADDVMGKLGYGTIQQDDIQEINNILELEKERPIEPSDIVMRPEALGISEGQIPPELAIQLPKRVGQVPPELRAGQRQIPVEEQTISRPEKLTTRMKLRGSMSEGL